MERSTITKAQVQALLDACTNQRDRSGNKSSVHQIAWWKDLVILAKERLIKELEEENRKLKQQLKAALGKAYDRL